MRFFWDRKGDHSIRCRVGQNWASAKWGGMVIPRVGMEVIVEFLDGDPDRPLVTGCVYNANNMPPNALPAHKTRSVFMSSTHRGSGFNEIRFEDESGQEEIWVHAQKYMNTVVEVQETHTVGASRHTSIGASDSETVGAEKDLTVGSNFRETIGASFHLTVGSDRSQNIGKDDSLSVGGSSSIDVAKAQQVNVGASYYVRAGTAVVIEAGATMCLKAGGSYITLSPAGIQIEGPLVRINCGGAPFQGVPVPTKTADKTKGPHAKRYDRSFKK